MPLATRKTRRPRASHRRRGAVRAALRLERHCVALVAEIDAVERSRAELCSIVSHDLRNPLTVILWSLRMLTKSIPPDGSARRHLDAIARASEEMKHMLHDLSDAARIPDGRLVLEVTEGSLASLVDDAVAMSRAAADTKALELRVAIAADAGNVRCDRVRITRVIASLLANAVRITPKGGTITVAARCDGDEGLVSVTDGGPGVPEDLRASVFEMPSGFAPGTPPRRPVSPSAALGLFVARGVIEAHGGRMWLEGDAGQGSTFVLTIPSPNDGEREEDAS